MAVTFVRYRYVLNVPPNAPLLTAEPPYDAADAATFEWSFSDPVTTDSQDAYQLQIQRTSDNVDVVDTTKTTSGTNSHLVAGGTLANTVNYRWRVKTWDSYDKESVWSAYEIVSPTAAATVAITAPTDTQAFIVEDITVAWSYSHPDSILQDDYRVRFYETTTNALEHDSGWITSTDTSYIATAITTGSWRIEVKVRTGGVESNTDSVNVTVDIITPDNPTLTIDNFDGYARVTVNNPSPTGDKPTINDNRIFRRITGDTTWERIALVGNNSSHKDYTAGIGVSYDYYVRAVGPDASITSIVFTNTLTSEPGIWLHVPGDEEATIHYFFLQLGNRKEDIQIESETTHFAGRTFPVTDFGQYEQQIINLDILVANEDFGYFRQLVRNRQVICYRDNRARKLFATFSNLSFEDRKDGVGVQFSLQQVDYTEVI